MKFTAIDLRTDECRRIFFEMSLRELIKSGGRNMTIIGTSEYGEEIITNISDLDLFDIQVVDCDSNRSQLHRE